MKLSYYVAVPCLIFGASTANAKVILATATSLTQAFKSATGGDRIVVSGDIGYAKIYGPAYSSQVTVDARAAHFKDTVVIYNASNIAFTGGLFGMATAGTTWGRSVQVYDSSNIGFDQAQFVGNGTSGGVNFSNVDGAYVANSSFSNLTTAGNFAHVTGGNIINNVVYGQTKDGFDLADTHDINASHNSCFGAKPSPGVHPDCIQIWSVAGKAVSSNINISDNLAYGNSQGFTKFDSGGGGTGISILRNVVESTYSQGIACYGCVNSQVKNNFLVTLKSAPHFVNLNVVGGTNNQIAGNTFMRSGSDAFVTPFSATTIYSAGLLASGAHAIIPDLATTTAIPIKLGTQVGNVPEPAIWTSLIAGFGLHGGAMRFRRARRKTEVAN